MNHKPFMASLALVVVLAAAFVGGRYSVPPCPEPEGGFAARDVSAHEVPRSGKWPAVRRKHLEREPACVVCGYSGPGIQVHHIKSFATFPELQLDDGTDGTDGNLVSLCGPEKHNCHFVFGHLFSFAGRDNWNVREDAALIRQRIKETDIRRSK